MTGARVISLALAAALTAAHANAAPDEARYSRNQYHLPSPGTGYAVENLVATHSRADEIFPTSRVLRRNDSSVLKESSAKIDIRYDFQGDRRKTIDDFLSAQPVTGLLVLKDDVVVLERYQYERNAGHRFLGNSMTKTVIAMLIGIAVEEGRIRSIEDLAGQYAVDLAGSEYGRTSIKALLRMSSGVKFREDYDGKDDIARLSRAVFGGASESGAAAVAPFNERTHPPGRHFYYASAETYVLALVLAAAVGDVTEYLSERIWNPIGAEADGAWRTDGAGRAPGYCCLSATLRDWGRLGRLLAHDGAWNGRQVIPRSWVVDATRLHDDAPHLAPGSDAGYFGYGFQVWLLPGDDRNFVLLGVYGQAMFIDPSAKIVMVTTAVYDTPRVGSRANERLALWRAVKARLQ